MKTWILREGVEGKRHMVVAFPGPMVPDSVRGDVIFRLVVPGMAEGDIVLGRMRDGTNVEGFLKYLQWLEIRLQEDNCADILEVFDLMQPSKSLLKSLDDLLFRHPGDPVEMEEKRRKSGMPFRYTRESVVYVDQQKEEIARAYREVIHPPELRIEEGVRRITFWMVDLATRDLERWEIVEEADGERRVEGEVVEEDLVWSRSLTVEDE
jgi:hypothetical protein